MSAPDIEQVLREIKQLPSLAAVVMKILRTFESDDLDIAPLAQQISQDQALSARVLRVANSAFYGFSGKIGSISEAVVVLGFNNVRSLVSAAGIIDSLSPAHVEGFDLCSFWLHSIGTGVCAQVLAPGARQDPETAFTAGLLHDIGKLVLLLYFRDTFEGVLRYQQQADCTWVEAERKLMNIDHARIGAEVAKLWKFPLAIQEAIRYHHTPDQIQSAPLADLIHVANAICHALEIGAMANDQVPALSHPAWQRLGLDWETLQAAMSEIEVRSAGASLLIA